MSTGCSPAKRLLPFYVNGSLEGEEHEIVRLHIETCAPCRGEMDLLLSLARAVESHGAALPATPVAASESRAPRRRGLRKTSLVAAAAVIVLVAGGLWSVLRPVRDGAAPGRPAEPYAFDLGSGPERGDEPAPILAARHIDRALTLIAFIPVSPAARYSADLVGARGLVLAHAEDVGPPDPLGRISWTVPPGLVGPGEVYEVAITRTDQAGERRIYRHTFRVESAEGDEQAGP